MKTRTILKGATLAAAVAVWITSGVGMAEEPAVKTKTIEHQHEGVVLEGFLAWPAEGEGKRPGVLVVHAWKGIGDHERETAKRLAALGYVAYACDVYGKGVRPKTNREAAAQAGKYRGDRKLFRARVKAGLDTLKAQANVDGKRTAAIGFCFGGGAVLELARSGADTKGVVSFHGNLDTPDPEDAKKATASILVLHGADDPHVPMEQVSNFIAEMRNAGVDWQFVAYGGAVHSFTHRSAGDDPSRGVAYDEKAATRSWTAMRAFFRELFGE
jgi:dienelactone hydrolase